MQGEEKSKPWKKSRGCTLLFSLREKCCNFDDALISKFCVLFRAVRMANLVARRYLTIFSGFVGLYVLKELYTKDCLPQTLFKIAFITKPLIEILYIKSFTCVKVHRTSTDCIVRTS